jgi:hypothetical protein
MGSPRRLDLDVESKEEQKPDETWDQFKAFVDEAREDAYQAREELLIRLKEVDPTKESLNAARDTYEVRLQHLNQLLTIGTDSLLVGDQAAIKASRNPDSQALELAIKICNLNNPRWDFLKTQEELAEELMKTRDIVVNQFFTEDTAAVSTSTSSSHSKYFSMWSIPNIRQLTKEVIHTLQTYRSVKPNN